MVFNIAKKIIPESCKPIIKKVENKLPKSLTTPLKLTMELDFQKQFVKQFKSNQSIILEDWRVNHSLDKVIEICGIKESTKILDVGCGISTVLHWVNGERYGIDPLADEYLKIYSYPDGIKVTKGSGESIPFIDKYFDVVFSTNALDHCSNPMKLLDEVWRVLSDTGYFILVVEIYPTKIDRGFEHPHSFTKIFLKTLLSNKFEIIFERYSKMKAIEEKVTNGDTRYYLVDSPNHTDEITLIMRKRNG